MIKSLGDVEETNSDNYLVFYFSLSFRADGLFSRNKRFVDDKLTIAGESPLVFLDTREHANNHVRSADLGTLEIEKRV